MITCRNCGTINEDNTVYCTNCGADLATQNAADNTQATVTPNYGAPEPEKGKGMAIASLVLGIVSFFCFPVITGTLGIIFGAVAKSQGSKRGMATAGIVCGILGLIAWIIMLAAGASFMGALEGLY